MTEQQGKKKTPVILAVGFLALALIAFGAAFYYFDGLAVVDSFFGTDLVADSSAEAADGSQETTSSATGALRLPEGMSEDAALRMWQEQIDSQANIERLLSGEVDKIVITSVKTEGDTSTLSIRADFADDTSADGVIGMRKYGEYWFFEYVTGLRGADAEAARPDSPLPSIDDIDVDALNTIIAQQVGSAGVTAAYAGGDIDQLTVREIAEGPGTRTLAVVMLADDGEVQGDVVAISSEVEGKDFWFVAKFNEQ